MIDIILVEPENAGNIGAVARIMKNFGFLNLILVEPKADHLCTEARNRAKWAQDVLEKAKKVRWNDVLKYDTKIATTAKLGRDYNMPRVPITPKQLTAKLKEINTSTTKIALVFGREGPGLTNEEIKACDFCLTIPANKDYPVLNISHAVGIVLYEIFQEIGKKKTGKYSVAGESEKKIIELYLKKVLNKIDFQTPEKKETQKTLWKRLIGKSFLTKREAMAFIGFLKKVIEKMK